NERLNASLRVVFRCPLPSITLTSNSITTSKGLFIFRGCIAASGGRFSRILLAPFDQLVLDSHIEFLPDRINHQANNAQHKRQRWIDAPGQPDPEQRTLSLRDVRNTTVSVEYPGAQCATKT